VRGNRIAIEIERQKKPARSLKTGSILVGKIITCGVYTIGSTGLEPSTNVEHQMQNTSCAIVDLSSESAAGRSYDNHPIAFVNDHVVRISTMTDAYHWHCHPDSDETFLALEGGLFIDLDDRTVELKPGNMFTVDRGVRHRTRPIGTRSVNLTFERSGAVSEELAAPS
jgi:mannose-6-phosphate isomerase-like protein (cupin superfamily)